MSDITDASPTTNHGVSPLGIRIANVVAFIVTLALNGVSAAGVLSPYSIGAISSRYPTMIKPGGGATSIWLCIYAVQAYFLIYQFFWPKKDEALLLHGVGFWFVISCMFNSLWIITFVQGTTAAMWLSTLLIVGLLFSMCKIYVNTSCWRAARPGGPLQAIALDVHISMYAGWVTVAAIVNIAMSLTTVMDAEPAALVVAMLVAALLLNTFVVVTRRDCIWGWVLAWSSYFISVPNKGDDAIYTSSLVVCGLIGLVSAAVGLHTTVMWFRGSSQE